MQEIERKFLVTDNSYRNIAYDKSEILQGYICSGHGHTVRVRTRANKGYLTIKGPSTDGISRFEWEKEISLQDARDLFNLCRAGRIEKTRYLVKNGKITQPVRGAALIGNGGDVIQKIDMVGQDLDTAQGNCGASSGMVPTDVGQPLIRVSSITVGGQA